MRLVSNIAEDRAHSPAARYGAGARRGDCKWTSRAFTEATLTARNAARDNRGPARLSTPL